MRTINLLFREKWLQAIILAQAVLLCACVMNFAMATNSSASENTYRFSDVSSSEWYANDDILGYVVDHNLMGGYGSGYFGPNDPITRGQVVTILYRIAGEPAVTAEPFSDVDYSLYYGQAINWARQTGVVDGYKDSSGHVVAFGPDDNVTREQLAKMLANYASKIEKLDTSSESDIDRFLDAGNVSSWALEPMAWAVEHGLISGVASNEGMRLDPSGLAQRCQVAKMVAVFHRDVLDQQSDRFEDYEIVSYQSYGPFDYVIADGIIDLKAYTGIHYGSYYDYGINGVNNDKGHWEKNLFLTGSSGYNGVLTGDDGLNRLFISYGHGAYITGLNNSASSYSSLTIPESINGVDVVYCHLNKWSNIHGEIDTQDISIFDATKCSKLKHLELWDAPIEEGFFNFSLKIGTLPNVEKLLFGQAAFYLYSIDFGQSFFANFPKLEDFSLLFSSSNSGDGDYPFINTAKQNLVTWFSQKGHDGIATIPWYLPESDSFGDWSITTGYDANGAAMYTITEDDGMGTVTTNEYQKQ